MLEKIYRSIPISRLLFYMMLPALLPLGWFSMHYWNTYRDWSLLSTHILAVHQHSELKKCKQHLNNLVRKNYSASDHFYVDHQLETMTFLKKEKEALEKLFQSRAYTGNELAEKRYLWLSSDSNRLLLNQGGIQTAENIQQTIELLAHPVEVDASDLKELLARIEGKCIGQPQLIVTHLKLNRKESSPGSEVFEMYLKLLKREFEPL